MYKQCLISNVIFYLNLKIEKALAICSAVSTAITNLTQLDTTTVSQCLSVLQHLKTISEFSIRRGNNQLASVSEVVKRLESKVVPFSRYQVKKFHLIRH